MFLFLHKPLLEYPSYIKYFYNNIIYASYIIVKMEGITYWFFSGSDRLHAKLKIKSSNEWKNIANQ